VTQAYQKEQKMRGNHLKNKPRNFEKEDKEFQITRIPNQA
jgi:hypothetical protein